jgi:hypothetical protein
MHYLVGEANHKVVHLKTLFHIFAHGCPMLEYESLYELFVSLQVFNNPTMHWYDGVSWILVEFIYNKIQATIIIAIQGV